MSMSMSMSNLWLGEPTQRQATFTVNVASVNDYLSENWLTDGDGHWYIYCKIARNVVMTVDVTTTQIRSVGVCDQTWSNILIAALGGA